MVLANKKITILLHKVMKRGNPTLVRERKVVPLVTRKSDLLFSVTYMLLDTFRGSRPMPCF